MKKSILKNYAKLIAKVGANIQKNQEVIIVSSLNQIEFIRILVKECYLLGAKDVKVEWSDPELTKLNYKFKKVKNLATLKEYEKVMWEERVRTLPVRIYIESDDPDALKGINQKKVSEVNKIKSPQIRFYRDRMDNNYQWVIAGVPSEKWAKKMFPELSKAKAMEALWDAILKVSRAYGDPIKNWEEHNLDLKKRSDYLNSLNLDRLVYKSSNGTDFTVGLIPNALWCAGGEETLSNKIFFNPNIPTEETFTSPFKGKIDGKVVATKPLSYNGEIIDEFYLIFKDGKVVEAHAKVGEDLLNEMINMDEGASMLGEVALIPYNSPINNTNLLFYSTLYDENASCHLALGRGFDNLIKDYDKYTLEERYNLGINKSIIHVDFMIGSKDLNITGYTKDNKEYPIFKDGNWAF